MTFVGYVYILPSENKNIRIQENFIISQEVDEKFRQAVFKRKGMKRGVLTDSFEEALLLWIKENKK